MAMVRELGDANGRAAKFEKDRDRWRREAGRLAMWGEATEAVTYERITSLSARVATLESELQEAEGERKWAVEQRETDKREADMQVAEAERQVGVGGW